MHYTGTIWRPPYEASSLLIEATAGCTHHKCKFCTLYDDLPFQFKMSPLEDIEADLKEVQGQLRLWPHHKVSRTFLTGANPFVLKSEKLLAIADLIHKYFPENKTIGSFARVTDISIKTDEELRELQKAGYYNLTIGIETADNEALKFMHKGYLADEIIKQSKRLDRAGIGYSFFYLTGVSGSQKGIKGAKLTAEVCNQLHPIMLGASMLTIYPESELFKEIQNGNWKEEGELEKFREMKVLVEELKIPVYFGALGASNAIPIQGRIPEDRPRLLAAFDEVIKTVSEEELRHYRTTLPHL